MHSSPLFDVGQNLFAQFLPALVHLLVHFAPPLDDGLILAALFLPGYPLCKKLTDTRR